MLYKFMEDKKNEFHLKIIDCYGDDDQTREDLMQNTKLGVDRKTLNIGSFLNLLR